MGGGGWEGEEACKVVGGTVGEGKRHERWASGEREERGKVGTDAGKREERRGV